MSKSGIRATYDRKNGICKINIGGKRGILDMSGMRISTKESTKKKASKKKPQLVMQAVDRTEYDPKTGKVRSLPDGEKIPLVFGTPKKPLKNLFEKMIGFKLNGNEHRACLSILDRAMNHQRINPQEICLNETDEESFLHGCYGIVVSLLEEKGLISREFTAHYPAITDKGMKALKFLKGFCDDKCCHGC